MCGIRPRYEAEAAADAERWMGETLRLFSYFHVLFERALDVCKRLSLLVGYKCTLEFILVFYKCFHITVTKNPMRSTSSPPSPPPSASPSHQHPFDQPKRETFLTTHTPCAPCYCSLPLPPVCLRLVPNPIPTGLVHVVDWLCVGAARWWCGVGFVVVGVGVFGSLLGGFSLAGLLDGFCDCVGDAHFGCL